MSEEILDLDILIPEPKKVKFEGNIINVNPPKLGELMALGKFAKKMQDADPETTDYEPIIFEIESIINKIVPELAGKTLNISQVTALVELISRMANFREEKSEPVSPVEEKKTP